MVGAHISIVWHEKRGDKIFEAMSGVRMNNTQKASFYSHAMPFYTKKDDKKRIDECYEQILAVNGFDELKQSTEKMYRILNIEQSK